MCCVVNVYIRHDVLYSSLQSCEIGCSVFDACPVRLSRIRRASAQRSVGRYTGLGLRVAY